MFDYRIQSTVQINARVITQRMCKTKCMFIAGWENHGQYTMTQHSYLELIEFI